MKIAVMRLRLILLSAYAINQPHSLFHLLAGGRRNRETRLIPNGSMATAMYQHIIDWSRSLYRETREDAILQWHGAAAGGNGRNRAFTCLSLWDTGHKLTEAER